MLICLHLRGVFGFKARSTAFFYMFFKRETIGSPFFSDMSCLFSVVFFLAFSTAGMDMILIMFFFFSLCTLPSHAKARLLFFFFFFFFSLGSIRHDLTGRFAARQDKTRREETLVDINHISNTMHVC
ncbi:hypothetical protein F4813DRAFT_158257 [Daldinia decipiens]|uniref:uncharacterized protein n=1 Tax=Daldinia decipiens TaxID=326647 RepID=UPI0020C5802F|nr:uncharacterized protein F4813DRAFT_158257 [Daldinia decipiens]KAI1655668.1 hypothetical protein F4813DRAFT_158257 [Daldinia decipiens]